MKFNTVTGRVEEFTEADVKKLAKRVVCFKSNMIMFDNVHFKINHEYKNKSFVTNSRDFLNKMILNGFDDAIISCLTSDKEIEEKPTQQQSIDFSIDYDVLYSALNIVKDFQGNNDIRSYLNGVHFAIHPGESYIEATDGNVFCRAELKMPYCSYNEQNKANTWSHETNHDFILDIKDIDSLLYVLKHAKNESHISFCFSSSGEINIMGNNCLFQINCTPIDQTYPNTHRMIETYASEVGTLKTVSYNKDNMETIKNVFDLTKKLKKTKTESMSLDFCNDDNIHVILNDVHTRPLPQNVMINLWYTPSIIEKTFKNLTDQSFDLMIPKESDNSTGLTVKYETDRLRVLSISMRQNKPKIK